MATEPFAERVAAPRTCRRSRWLPAVPGRPAILAALTLTLLMPSALLAGDGTPPSKKASQKTKREAPRLFIGAAKAKTGESKTQVATADVKEEVTTSGATSRGLQRNSKLQWRSVRAPAKPEIQQTAHEEGPALNSDRDSVLKDRPAAELPSLDPMADPFRDRLAAQPSGGPGDSSSDGSILDDGQPGFGPSDDSPAFDNGFGPPDGDGDLPSTRTPATDNVDPYGDQPKPDNEDLPAPKQPQPLRPVEPGDGSADGGSTAPPQQLPPPSRARTPEEQKDINYRNSLAEECEEGLQELRIKTLAATDLHKRLDISEKGTVQKDFPISCPVDDSIFHPRDWNEMYIAWTASGLCHKPLYFEERHLERYGHSTGPYTQPFVSMAHFFGSLLVLPYNMGIRTPDECVYALGHYRPGSCAPYLIPALPFTPRAALFQAGAVVGTAAVLP